jgi:ATP-binding cassette subfamily B protein
LRILRETRDCWRALAGIAALNLLSIPVALLLPIPLKIVVDSVLGSQPACAILEENQRAPYNE